MSKTLIERVVELHHDGCGQTEIAEMLGQSPETVRTILERAGIARPAHRNKASMQGDNLADPKRADRGLRQF